MMNFTKIQQAIDETITENKVLGNSSGDIFKFGIKSLDSHIETILKGTEASYPQISLVALAIHGFILSHGGVENTSMYVFDYSNSSAGKSHNIAMQSKMLLNGIIKEQDNLQLLASDEPPIKRYKNVHRGKITVPALYQCLQTVRAQIIMDDEAGISMQKDDDTISEVTKLYGATEASVPVLKTEVPTSISIVPVALSYIGASSLTYFGKADKLLQHMKGGFANRPFPAYNNHIKSKEEIITIRPPSIDYEYSNKKALELLSFARANSGDLTYDAAAEAMLLQFKQEIQGIKKEYEFQGNDDHGLLYARTFQNTESLVRILHGLKCFESKTWSKTIDASTTKIAISFVKTVVFSEIDKLIAYMTDDELLTKEEKKRLRINKCVKAFYDKKGNMPQVRDVTMNTKISRDEFHSLTKGYLEVNPMDSKLRYCTPKL